MTPKLSRARLSSAAGTSSSLACSPISVASRGPAESFSVSHSSTFLISNGERLEAPAGARTMSSAASADGPCQAI
jgi:hypothetical protein